MGLFKRKNANEYTLSEAMKKLQMPEYSGYMAVATDPDNPIATTFKLVEEPKRFSDKNVVNPILERNENRREKFINEINGNGEYSTSNKPGRVIPASYNNWQDAKKYNHGNKYGQYR